MPRSISTTPPDPVRPMRMHDAIGRIDAQAWQSRRGEDSPFLDHGFLAALEQHGCVRRELGWQAAHLEFEFAPGRHAFAPAWRKTNSHGEFVFDWNWAAASEQAGIAYYPKLLIGIPYSPVPGPRVLAGPGSDDEALCALLEALPAQLQDWRLHSAHLNFHTHQIPASALEMGWLPRSDWQYHWHNRGWQTFDDFLGALNRKKRKNILAERRRLEDAGFTFRTLGGTETTAELMALVYRLYQRTFSDKGNVPALTASFFLALPELLGDRLVLVLAEKHGQVEAMALCLRSSTHLYGRYWGSFVEQPGLHFETCYHQGIEYCIRHGLSVFEPGAQGEHKIARGFTPVRTHSLHWLGHRGLREAVAHSLQIEAPHVERHGQLLMQHSPYRS